MVDLLEVLAAEVACWRAAVEEVLVVLTEVEWTAENGLVTAAQKIQRSKSGKKYEEEIKVCFFFSFKVYCFVSVELTVVFCHRRRIKASRR